MKILYCGINSKYIHTMPAGWFLTEFLKSKNIHIDEVYHNVNEDINDVISDLVMHSPDKLLLSVYIFNVKYVKKLISQIKTILPNCQIIVGGPEVDDQFPAHHIIYGEGELALWELLQNGGPKIIFGENIQSLDNIPSPYTPKRLKQAENKLVYYESSRGCPFSCSYCMASLSKNMRFFSLERVKQDLKIIVEHKAKIVKFTDRTFNVNIKRTNEILLYIKENFSKSNTCFHFEVAADLFDNSTIEILKQMPPGLVQIEAGVQSINPKSLEAVNRKFDKDKFKENIEKIISHNNIHVHLDLIAGLPNETLSSFINAVNWCIELKPHVLQLGFLKFLKHTPIRDNYSAEFEEEPPYEVLSTPSMSAEDLLILKKVETIIDKMYNKNRFYYTFSYLMQKYSSPFQFFWNLANYFEENDIGFSNLESQYEAILKFTKNESDVKELLRFDFLISNNSRRVPRTLRRSYSALFRQFKHRYPNNRQFMYSEFFKDNELLIVRFDYNTKNPVTNHYIAKFIVDP